MRALGMCAAALLLAGGCGGNTVEACATDFAGCKSFTDATEESASRVIIFGGSLGKEYAPSCLMVKRGQAVTFGGDFSVHPLVQACGVTSSFQGPVASGMTTSVKFEEAGDWGYFSQSHGAPNGTKMAGLIRVVP